MAGGASPPLRLCNILFFILMSYAGDAYRFFTSFRMTCLRYVVILSEAKDLCGSNTINIKFMLLHNTTVCLPFIPNSQFPIPNLSNSHSFSIFHFPFSIPNSPFPIPNYLSFPRLLTTSSSISSISAMHLPCSNLLVYPTYRSPQLAFSSGCSIQYSIFRVRSAGSL